MMTRPDKEVVDIPYRKSMHTTCPTPNCYVTTYIDGVQVFQAGSLAQPPDAARINISDLGGVEFYPDAGTGPVQYNATGSGCGTLLLWTRER